MIRYIEKRLSAESTIEGMLKGNSNLPLSEAKDIFYKKNTKRNYKVGEVVLIPILVEG